MEPPAEPGEAHNLPMAPTYLFPHHRIIISHHYMHVGVQGEVDREGERETELGDDEREETGGGGGHIRESVLKLQEMPTLLAKKTGKCRVDHKKK